MSRSSARSIGVIAGLFVSLLLTLAVPVGAQVRRQANPYYDVTKEVTLTGTIASVVAKPAGRTIPGPHLFLTTASGEVDASLGMWGLQGKGALSVAPGETIEVTGVMKTLNEKEIFVARTVKSGDQVYVMRNEHGIPVSPHTRQRLAEKAQKGESL